MSKLLYKDFFHQKHFFKQFKLQSHFLRWCQMCVTQKVEKNLPLLSFECRQTDSHPDFYWCIKPHIDITVATGIVQTTAILLQTNKTTSYQFSDKLTNSERDSVFEITITAIKIYITLTIHSCQENRRKSSNCLLSSQH